MTRFATSMTLLRGVLLLAAGLLALFSPAFALTILVMAGGVLLIADGLLGLASFNYGANRDVMFYLVLLRGALAVLAGLAVLFSPQLATMLTMSTLLTLVGIAAIIIGVIELLITLRDRAKHPSIMPLLATAALYIAVGVVLLLVPFASATVLMQIGGAILLVVAILHLTRTWKAYRFTAQS